MKRVDYRLVYPSSSWLFFISHSLTDVIFSYHLWHELSQFRLQTIMSSFAMIEWSCMLLKIWNGWPVQHCQVQPTSDAGMWVNEVFASCIITIICWGLWGAGQAWTCFVCKCAYLSNIGKNLSQILSKTKKLVWLGVHVAACSQQFTQIGEC